MIPPSAAALFGAQRNQEDSAPAPTSGSPAGERVVFNPRSHYDAGAGVFVMEYRNTTTGEVERQVPDSKQLRAYADAKKLVKGGDELAETPAQPPEAKPASAEPVAATTAPAGANDAGPDTAQTPAATADHRRVSVEV
jgi:hypothetical protein